jgi:Protein of unknown function (DUF3253)
MSAEVDVDTLSNSPDALNAPEPSGLQGQIEAAILALVMAVGTGRSISPLQAACAVAGPHPDDWGKAMPATRRAAIHLAQTGQIVILRKGKVTDPMNFRGVYRLALVHGSTQSA